MQLGRTSTTRLSAIMNLVCALQLVLFAATASAEGLAGLPSCAHTCAQTAATAVNCTLDNTKCLCAAHTFNNAVQQCINSPDSSCSATDKDTAQRVLNSMCVASSSPTTTSSNTGNSSSTASASSHSSHTTSTGGSGAGNSTSTVGSSTTGKGAGSSSGSISSSTSVLATPIPPITTAPFPSTTATSPVIGTTGSPNATDSSGASSQSTTSVLQTSTSSASGASNSTTATSGASGLSGVRTGELVAAAALIWVAGGMI